MREHIRTPWLIRILSLFFAILFFYNANLTKLSKDVSTTSALTATASKVPVNVTYNQDKYYISGFEQTVDVELSTVNKILLDKESNSETRSFSVVMDLTKLKEGTHEVPLEITGLPNAVKAKIDPEKLTVTIEKRTSNKFEVEPSIDSSIFADGFEIESAEVDPQSVTLTGAEDTVSKVSRVIAGVSDKSNVSSDFFQKVKPYAIDEQGNLLDVRIEPESIRVDVYVKQPSKKVKVKAVQTGTVPQGIKDYTFSIKDDEVNITGPKETLDEISSLELKIDVSGIKETVGNSYTVAVPNGVTVDPETVFVTVIPEKKTETSSDKTASLENNLSTSTKKSDKIPVSTKK